MSRLLLFDIDGTLLWTNGAGRESTRLALLDVFGTDAGLDQHVFGGKTDWQTLLDLLIVHGHSADEIERTMPAFHDAITRNLESIIGNYDVRACPGAVTLIETLHQRNDVMLGLVTGNVGRTAAVKLRAAGYDPAWFPVGAYGHEAADRNHLPPLALARAVEHYRQSIHPEHVIVIGDTPADVACARALGAKAVAVGTGFCERADLVACNPDHLIDDLSAFLEILDN
jgi:phosphoglycolate phosphatase-like HAD superfamily hydrolase